MSCEDLLWLANPATDHTDDYARDEARAELHRRAARDAALLQPRTLLRQPQQD